MALIAKVPFTEGAGAPIETISGAPLTLVAGSMAWETIAGKGAVRLTTAGPLNLGILTLPLVASPLSPPGTVLLARRLYTAAGQVPLFSETSESFESDVAPGRRCRLGANAPDVLTSGGVDPIGPTVCG
jgi:hypothetical protein